jgi:hypothetical protein
MHQVAIAGVLDLDDLRNGVGFRIQQRRAVLDLESLRDVGKVSIIR